MHPDIAAVLAGERAWAVLCGDALTTLRAFPDGCVHCCITSPPYFGLRDYGIAGQIGLEESPGAYVARLVEVFREVWRVLRHDGTLWLNLGDSYASSGTMATAEERNRTRSSRLTGGMTPPGGRAPTPPGFKTKDLLGIPWRVAFALQADGWYLRSDIIWSKPNPMPESVTDRPTKAHEYLFLLAKGERYFYDAEAIKEPAEAKPQRRFVTSKVGGYRDVPGQGRQNGTGVPPRDENAQDYSNRNRRSVWEVATQPYPGAHFATFPEALVEPCILAGTSDRGCCAGCGAPWERVVERETIERGEARFPTGRPDKPYGKVPRSNTRGVPYREFLSETWQPTCPCNLPTLPCIVLDPFAGSGTTLALALRHNRRAVGIELNPEYVSLIDRRIGRETPLALFSEGE